MEPQPPSTEISDETKITVVAIDSDSDDITKAALNHRLRHVYPYLEAKGFELVRLQETDATPENVSLAAVQPSVKYLTGSGHGKADSYLIDHHEPIFQVGQYAPEAVQGKIIHFLSCKTADELGVDFVAQGSSAFFGYEDDFVFLREDADIFFECDSEIDRAFADGLTADEVYLRVKEKFERHTADLYAAGSVYTANLLEGNLACLSAPIVSAKWGNGSAGLTVKAVKSD